MKLTVFRTVPLSIIRSFSLYTQQWYTYVIQVCWQLASRIRMFHVTKTNLMPMWLYFFVIYYCGIWAFSSSRKHLLITLLRLEFVVLTLYFSIYFCGILAFFSSRKHLLITLLRLEFVVLTLYFSIYFYLCGFNYSSILILINMRN